MVHCSADKQAASSSQGSAPAEALSGGAAQQVVVFNDDVSASWTHSHSVTSTLTDDQGVIELVIDVRYAVPPGTVVASACFAYCN